LRGVEGVAEAGAGEVGHGSGSEAAATPRGGGAARVEEAGATAAPGRVATARLGLGPEVLADTM
jgi:hypothetical protein